MVVDDDEDVRAVIRDVFEDDGWRVTEASGGARALALLRAHPLPDVLVLDLVMPGVDGLAVLTELSETFGPAGLPVVVLSAGHALLSHRFAETLGADDCFTKPVDPEALRDRCAALAASTDGSDCLSG
jgi:CheY-like chemotaxis protein